jgi:MSHA biogenesis protein MshO
MRRARPDRLRGFTLIEMVVSMVVVGIIVAVTIQFALPLRQAVDTSVRAELTDIADNTLQRIGRDIRLALPNSVRVTTSGSSSYVEFLAIRTAGRYRSQSSGAACGAATDELGFDNNTTPDACFKTFGPLAITEAVSVNNDFLVLGNYGAISGDFVNQNAYETAAPTVLNPRNRRLISAFAVDGPRHRVEFAPAAVAFSRALHDSPGARFFIISGPVTYQCNTGTGEIRRHSGYGIASAQPTVFVGGALIATNATTCSFDYAPNGVAPQIGVLTLRLTLARTVSSGATESVSLYHGVHVNNVP